MVNPSTLFVPSAKKFKEKSSGWRAYGAPPVIGGNRKDGRATNGFAGQSFAGADLPGVYTIVSGQTTQHFAVNLSPSESRTAPLPPEELQRLGVPLGNTFKASPERTAQKQRQLYNLELENRQKLWRWLIIAVLVLLVVEIWVAASLTRRASFQEIRA